MRAGREGADRELTLGSGWLYPAKALFTRVRSGAWLLRTGGRPDRNGVRILFYHRVSDDRDELAVTPRRFREQMAFLASAGYRGVDVATLAARLATGDAPDDVVGISFDDGYLDVAREAVPVLAEHGFDATVFVATAVTSGRAVFTWYDRQPPVIEWDELVELERSSPLRFEAHTVTHPNLLALDEEGAREEIGGGKRELEERIGRKVEVFCYPAGLFGARERRLVGEAGFRYAVSCERGVNTPDTDPLALKRIQIDARDRLLDFRAKALGGHDTAPPLRAAYRRLRYGMPPARSRS
jgi:peptidoglycan/xylan/chitin deacetylase (PgdA/CDA1 family)